MRVRSGREHGRAIAALPSVRAALIVRFADARIERDSGAPIAAAVRRRQRMSRMRARPITPPWTVVRGRDATRRATRSSSTSAIASAANLQVGGTITLRASCVGDREALPPAHLQVVGIAEFPFARNNEDAMGGSLDALKAACGGNVGDEADLLLVTSVRRRQRDRGRHSRGACRTFAR